MKTSTKNINNLKLVKGKEDPGRGPNLEMIIAYICSNKNDGLHKHHGKKNISLDLAEKTFKLLAQGDKDIVVRYTAEYIRAHYFKNLEFKSQIYKFATLFGSNKDWGHTNQLLESLLLGSLNLDFLTTFCKKVFSVIDDEFSRDNISSNVTGTCLAFITEIGVHVKSELDKSNGLSNSKNLLFIEFLTSNMLARSNVNNETMRIGLIYYFSKVDPSSHMNIEKILSRFGQSLLEHVLNTYFTNSKKSDLAFYFIIEHLDNFIFSTPALAEMSNSVLHNQMLKHPNDFPVLMKKYISYKVKNISYNTARSLVVHLSFLLKEACEVNQKNLIDSMLELTFSFIYLFEHKSKETSANLCEILGEIISVSKSTRAKEISSIIYDKILVSKKIVDSVNAYKLIQIDLKGVNIYNKVKFSLDENKKPTPLDEILLLAS